MPNFDILKSFISILFVFSCGLVFSQESPATNTAQASTEQRVNELVDKIAEYHRLTDGEQDGYRIKIHFGNDREEAEAVRVKFSNRFPECITYKEYQQPYFVVLVGDYKTKLEAFDSRKKILPEFPNAFIVKGRIKVK